MSSAPTPEPSSQEDTVSGQLPPAPIIPVVKDLPVQTQSGIPAEITQTISRVEPDVALDYVNKWVNLEYQDREKERTHQLQLAQAKLDLEEKKEVNRATERTADRDLIKGSLRWGLGIFLAVFLSALGFSYVVKDADGKIPQTVLSIAAGVLGGTGVTAGLRRNGNNPDDTNRKS